MTIPRLQDASSSRRHVRAATLVALLALGALLLSGCADLQGRVESPTGKWVAKWYEVDAGAMAGTSGRVVVIYTQSGRRRVVWTGPPLPDAPVWTADDILAVGEQSVDVRTGSFSVGDDDFAGGGVTSNQAIADYFRAIAASDLPTAQRLSEPIVTAAILRGERTRLFGGAATVAIDAVDVEQKAPNVFLVNVVFARATGTTATVTVEVGCGQENGDLWYVHDVRTREDGFLLNQQ